MAYFQKKKSKTNCVIDTLDNLILVGGTHCSRRSGMWEGGEIVDGRAGLNPLCTLLCLSVCLWRNVSSADDLRMGFAREIKRDTLV